MTETAAPYKFKSAMVADLNLISLDPGLSGAIAILKNNTITAYPFPDVPLIMKGCRKPHDGVADALCLLQFGLREFMTHGSLIFEQGGHIGLESINEAACSDYDRTS